jgi:mono/diheme cytochrome c family protein
MMWGLLCLAVACGGGSGGSEPARDSSATYAEPQQPPVRMTMAALHASGGTPPGWVLRPAKGDAARGRQVFDAQGCGSCHRIEGEKFAGGATDESRGPDLTGMGAHHPPGYFVEAILSPSAVLVDGPGWRSEQGRSTMPVYPDMTIADLTDVVAYLSSLTTGGMHDHAAMMRAQAARAPSGIAPHPAPPAGPAGFFFVQRYDVLPGRLEDFEHWFATAGRAGFLAYDGVVSVDTWVVGGRPSMATVVGFRSDAAARAFLNDPRTEAFGAAFDQFIGPHGHQMFRTPPVYRVPSLSVTARR